MLENANKAYVIAYGSVLKSNVPNWSETSHKHPEADTLLICLINESSQFVPELSILWVSPDTDVLMLTLHYISTQSQSASDIDIVFQLLTSKGRRSFPINIIINYFGADICSSLLGLYVFTGCDQIGRFKSITKERTFKAFLNTVNSGNSEITDCLKFMGEEIVIPVEHQKSLERLTVLFFISKKKELTERYASCGDIGVLRWKLQSKFSEENDLLPPTPAALKFHIMRANFVTFLWKRLMRCLSPVLPNMIGNGWNDDLTPVMTDELPAPEFSLELTVCGCKKTHCSNKRCSCFKFELKCTDACHCLDCQNELTSFEEIGFDSAWC